MAQGFGDVTQFDGFDVVTEDNFKHFIQPMRGEASASGYIPRDRDAVPLGSQPGTTKMPSHLVKSLDELKHLLKTQEDQRSGLADFIKSMVPEWCNQSPTNSCWAFAWVHGVLVAYALTGKPHERLSPYSVSAPINVYRDVGGWSSRACQFTMREGVASDKLWPFSRPGMSSGEIQAANRRAITGSRNLYEPSRADAANRQTIEAWDIDSWAGKLTALWMKIPVPDGYNYEGHATCSAGARYDEASDTFWVLDIDSYTRDGSLHARWRKGQRLGLGSDSIACRVSEAAA